MTDSSVQPDSSARLPDGREILYYSLSHPNGNKLEICDYGARISGIWMPDRDGNLANCVQRFDDPADLAGQGTYFGATIGRFGNRLAGAGFDLNGRHYTLDANEGRNTLHGGFDGYNNRIWTVRRQAGSLVCSLTSPDGDQGFPGELRIDVEFSLLDSNTISIRYTAKCDQDTILNLTNHSYFALGGPRQASILDQILQINADFYTPTDDELLPTGEVRPVSGTPFDFTEAHAIGDHIHDEDSDLKTGLGYDHNFVLRRDGRGGLVEAARVYDPQSGRELTCLTTEPGVQLYTANQPLAETGHLPFEAGVHSALCLETQSFPNSMQRGWFPSPVLRAGETWQSETRYRFTVR